MQTGFGPSADFLKELQFDSGGVVLANYRSADDIVLLSRTLYWKGRD